MDSITLEMLNEAKDSFLKGNYKLAEPLLQQLILRVSRNPEIFQMLGTIYYEQGQFNKAIRTFQRALEIDPSYTDASVGLSIVLNDIGKYDDAKKVFLDAQEYLSKKAGQRDPFIDEKLASKHEELGDLYCQYKRYKEGLDQFLRAKNLSSRKLDLGLRICDCYISMEEMDKALKELRQLVREYPQHGGARTKLGIFYFNSNRLAEAAEQWEAVLAKEPNNSEAKRYLRMVQTAGITSADLNL